MTAGLRPQRIWYQLNLDAGLGDHSWSPFLLPLVEVMGRSGSCSCLTDPIRLLLFIRRHARQPARRLDAGLFIDGAEQRRETLHEIPDRRRGIGPR